MYFTTSLKRDYVKTPFGKKAPKGAKTAMGNRACARILFRTKKILRKNGDQNTSGSGLSDLDHLEMSQGPAYTRDVLGL